MTSVLSDQEIFNEGVDIVMKMTMTMMTMLMVCMMVANPQFQYSSSLSLRSASHVGTLLTYVIVHLESII